MGIEVEFLVEGRSPEAALRALAEGLREHTKLPLAVICLHGKWEKCPACEGLTDEVRHTIILPDGPKLLNVISPHCMDVDMSKHAKSNQDFDFLNYFHIMEEHLMLGVGDIQKSWQSIEVTTPVLTSQDVKAGLPQIKELIGGLKQIVPAVGINGDCGLHVHLGYAATMTLLKAKRVVSLVLLLEMTLLDPLVSPDRRGGLWRSRLSADAQIYGKAGDSLLSLAAQSSNFRAHIPAFNRVGANRWNSRNPEKLYAALVRTWNCRSLYHLQRLMMDATGATSGAALCIRWDDDLAQIDGTAGSTTTVEFRYLQMTFDPVLVHKWVTILSAIMKLGLQEAGTFKLSFQRLLTTLDFAEKVGQEYVWADILHELGLGSQIPFWQALIENAYEKGLKFVGTKDGLLRRDEYAV